MEYWQTINEMFCKNCFVQTQPPATCRVFENTKQCFNKLLINTDVNPIKGFSCVSITGNVISWG